MPGRSRTPAPEVQFTFHGGTDLTIAQVGNDNDAFYLVFDSQGRQVEDDVIPVAAGADRTIDIAAIMSDRPPGTYEIRVFLGERPGPGVPPGQPAGTSRFQHIPPRPVVPAPGTPQVVQLARSAMPATPDQLLYDLIQGVTQDRSFAAYVAFVDPLVRPNGRLTTDSFAQLLAGTWMFLRQQTPQIVDSGQLGGFLVDNQLPYINDVAQKFNATADLDPDLLMQPFPVELIWSYWHEEGGLVQSLNHILARFQNRRPGSGVDPLARFDLNPLRPLRTVLWAWAEDEQARLTVRRRAAEYEFEYGLKLIGRAVPPGARYVERRAEFLEAFHTLLFEAHLFFENDDDMTKAADGFAVANALRDTHIVLSQGASNQFGDLPTVARVEMLVMQWLLAQDEMRDFLGGRPMVPYDEPWMDRVDTMKTLNHWSGSSITNFHDLAFLGEQLLLSIRYGNWNAAGINATTAGNWARTWRNAIQRYTHAYRSVTGVDLIAAVDSTMPAKLLARRAAMEFRRA